MDHLKTIKAPVTRLTLGVNPNVAKYLSWRTFDESWAMVDEGKPAESLPIYRAFKKYYEARPLERRQYEAKLLGIASTDGEDIALEWKRRHIQLYHSIKRDGFDPSKREKPIAARIRGDGAIHLIDGNHTVSILRHLKHRKKVEVEIVEREQGWLSLKQQLYGLYGEKKLYQPTRHPDLDD